VLQRLTRALAQAAQRDAFWLALLVLALLVSEALGAAGVAVYSYDHWDNFEYYTPMIAAAHGRLLSGDLPLWNPHQHLGESFLANPQMGTFYPPYTLAFLAVTGLGLGWKWLCGLIAVAHVMLGACGGFVLLRHLGVRASLAFIAALGLASAGYLRAGAAFWIFYAPTFGWFTWTLLGAARLLEGSRRVRDGALFVLGLVAQAYVGHPQILVYVWLAVGLFCAGYLLVLSVPWRARLAALLGLGVQALAAGLLSLLTMLPIFLHTQHTVRKAAMTFDDFVRISVSPFGLLGLLLPGYRVRDGFIVQESCAFMLHQAAWLVPALLLGGGLWLRAERQGLRKTPDPALGTTELPGTAERRLGRTAAVLALTGAVFLVFALGHYVKVYGYTYGVPVWSSFRYPHKFLCVALPCLGLAAALGLELIARAAPLRGGVRWGVSCAAVALALGLGLRFGWAKVMAQPVPGVGLAAALVLLGLAPFVHKAWARGALGVASIVSGAAMVMLGQTFAPHLIDEPHLRDSALYAQSGQERVLPVHIDRDRFDIVSRLLYQSATQLGIDSVTGLTTSMAPDWYLAYLPSNSRGLLPEASYKELLPSHFLRSLNVRYVVAPRHHEKIERWLRRAHFHLDRELDTVALYRTDDTLPRAYFASQVLPFSDAEFRRGLLRNEADLRTAYVEGNVALPPAPSAAVARGEVLRADFSDAERSVLELESPEGGFVVISVSYDPSWVATLDGAAVPLWRTNAMLQGLAVPAGRHTLVLTYQNAGLRYAAWAALVGLALLAGLWALQRRALPRVAASGVPSGDALLPQ